MKGGDAMRIGKNGKDALRIMGGNDGYLSDEARIVRWITLATMYALKRNGLVRHDAGDRHRLRFPAWHLTRAGWKAWKKVLAI